MFREGIPQARGGGTKGSVPNCANLGPWRKEPGECLWNGGEHAAICGVRSSLR